MIIRNALLTDENIISEICCNSRFAPISEISYRELFSLRWATSYLKSYTSYCFVAEEDKEVIGFIVSTPDTIEQERNYKEKYIPYIKSKIDKNDPDYKIYDHIDDSRNSLGEFLASYPAHLHINLTSSCRGKGIGTKLMNAMINNLKKEGIPGVHLGVMEKNKNAVTFYIKNGFKELKKEYISKEDGNVLFMGKILA